ncbi:hypothetical protein HMI54_006027 [Coelomomyces lativittatus]|nr:hypothetical protein HMI54_006027 [Coelomomyces lativittatus]
MKIKNFLIFFILSGLLFRHTNTFPVYRKKASYSESFEKIKRSKRAVAQFVLASIFVTKLFLASAHIVEIWNESFTPIPVEETNELRKS